MPQSLAIGNAAKESGGNLQEVADTTTLLLALVVLSERQNQLLTAINITLGKMGPEFTEPDEIDLGDH